MSKIKYLVSRFKQMKQTYIGEQGYSFFYLIDYIFAFIIHGASISDYFAYNLYNSRYAKRKEWITYRGHKKIQNIVNDKEQVCKLRDKSKFNQIFSDVLGRDWIDISCCDYIKFSSFIRSNDYVFLKDIYGLCGIGTQKISCNDIDIHELYETLKTDNNAHYIMESVCRQIDTLSQFHPWSINTIRIVTLLYENEVHIMSASFRMGNNKKNIDNLHAKGIAAHIDIESGIIFLPGFDKHNISYLYHPITELQIVGFKMPFWEECKKFVVEMAYRIPEVGYIGWDVVLQEDGKCILIEGNDNADHDVQQLHYKGLWKEYKAIIKELK